MAQVDDNLTCCHEPPLSIHTIKSLVYNIREVRETSDVTHACGRPRSRWWSIPVTMKYGRYVLDGDARQKQEFYSGSATMRV